MPSNEVLRAIGAAAARWARNIAAQADAAANDVIELVPLLRPWEQGAWAAGDVCAHAGAPYKCIQSHDSTGNAAWSPDKVPALFAPYHATDARHALPYAPPTHAEDAYNAGEWMVYVDGEKYECLADGTVYPPDRLPAAWRKEDA